jgi:uncharacterized membrane-anchored protein
MGVSSWPFWLRSVIVGVGLTGALVWMVAGRIMLLQNGTEVVLKTKPVDPRSLFRGHYARLNYDINRVGFEKEIVPAAKKWRRYDRAFVVLEKGGDGFWAASGFSNKRPVAKAGQVVIVGYVRNNYSRILRVRYGIEKYFAPKVEALKLERIDRKTTPVGVIVRVSESGEAAISGLMIDGKKVYDEPLF